MKILTTMFVYLVFCEVQGQVRVKQKLVPDSQEVTSAQEHLEIRRSDSGSTSLPPTANENTLAERTEQESETVRSTGSGQARRSFGKSRTTLARRTQDRRGEGLKRRLFGQTGNETQRTGTKRVRGAAKAVSSPSIPAVCASEAAEALVANVDPNKEAKTNEARKLFSFSGSALQHHARQMVFNVKNFFMSTKKNPELLLGLPNVLTARAVNLHRNTVSRILNSENLLTPGKKRNSVKYAQNRVDSFDRDMIHRIIKDFYADNMPPFFNDIYQRFLKQRRENDAKATEQSTILLGCTSPPGSSGGQQASADIREATPERSVQQGNTDTPSRPGQPVFQISRTTFRKVLYTLGYKYGKINERLAIVQRNDVVLWRRRYLRILKRNRDSLNPREIWYLDETWVDTNARFGRGWVPKSCPSFKMYKDFTCAKIKVGKGPRLVVIGVASSKTGMIIELTKVYRIKKADVADDYHTNVNGQLFIRYITELLSYLKTMDDELLVKVRSEATGSHYQLSEDEKANKISRNPILIVMDNAPYHTIDNLPKPSDRKEVIHKWLQEQQEKGEGVILEPLEDMLKVELVDMLTDLKKKYNYYTIDNLISEYGHKVVRLPPYNCDLNPIEFVWSNIKGAIKKMNREQTLDSVEKLTKETINNYKLETWMANYQHCLNLGEKYWVDDGIAEQRVIQLQIQFNEEDVDDEAVFPDAPERTFATYRGIADMNDFAALGLSNLVEYEAAQEEEEENLSDQDDN